MNGDGGVRSAAVAGSFYPADAEVLRRTVTALLAGEGAPGAARGVVVPHAGYVYSGGIAGRTYARVAPPPAAVVLAVNHRGRGAAVASSPWSSWETPLGRVEVDRELEAAITRRARFVVADPRGHEREHSLEVQLPFLQVMSPSLRFVPLSIGTHDLDLLEALGNAVAEAVAGAGRGVLVVASTDFTHYEDAASARARDERALERIVAVDGPGLLRRVLEERTTMCGVAPTAASLVALRALGVREAELVAYGNSGDVTGDLASVVGYAGLLLR